MALVIQLTIFGYYSKYLKLMRVNSERGINTKKKQLSKVNVGAKDRRLKYILFWKRNSFMKIFQIGIRSKSFCTAPTQEEGLCSTEITDFPAFSEKSAICP